MKHKNFFRTILAVAILVLLASGNSWAATITSAATGNWSAGATWVGGVVPTATDDVVIAAGHTVTLDVTQSVVNVTVNGTLSWTTANTLTVTGNITVNQGGAISNTTNGGIALAGTYSAFTINTGGSAALYNLTVNNTALGATLQGDVTINGVLTVNGSSGKLTQASGTTTLSFAGAAVVNNSPYTNLTLYNVTTSAAVTTATSWTIAGDLDATGGFTATVGVIVFKNQGTPNHPKLIKAGTPSIANLKIDDGSYLATAQNLTITGTTNAFEVVGSGSFKATAGTITFSTAAAVITTSPISTCEFNNLTFNAAATTTSNFTIKGNVNNGAAGNGLTASAPSTISFDNLPTPSTSTITSQGDGDFTFNNIVVKNGKTVSLSGDFIVNITGDITVENNAIANLNIASGTATALTLNGTTQNIYNYGALNFSYVTIATGVVVQTESDMTISGTLTTTGTGTFTAGGNSTVTFSGTTPLASATSAKAVFQNIFFTGAAALGANSFTVKGNFYSSTSTAQTAANSVTFSGNAQQRIYSDGTATIALGNIILDNPAGLKLEENISLGQTGAATITFTNGSIDLNGTHTITLTGAAPRISGETYSNTFINTGIGTGEILINTPLAIANVDATNIGVTSIAGPTNVTVARYVEAKEIGNTKTVKRYYSLNGTVANITAATFAYFNNELNGNTDANLNIYATQDATKTVIGNTIASQWVPQTTAVTTGTNGGTLALSGGAIPFGTTAYFGFVDNTLALSSWPTTNVVSNYDLATMPLVAGQTGKVLLRFAVSSTAGATITGFTVNLNQNVAGILSNFKLYKDENQDVSNYAAPTNVGTFTVNSSTLTLAGLSEALTAGTTYYYYIIADVSNAVTTASPHITLSISTNGITAANCDLTGTAISSPEISFTGQVVTANVNNTPLSHPVVQGASAVPVYGFTLQVPANTPAINLTNVVLKATLSDGAVSTDFTGFKLYYDANKNGLADDGISSGSVNMDAQGNITINATTPGANITADRQFLVVCDVASGSTVGGKLSLSIETYNDFTITSPALMTSGGPFDGGTFTVDSSATVPTRLVVTSFGLTTTPATDTPEKLGREVVSGSNITIEVQAQDANGNPANVTSLTGLSVTITSGTATVGITTPLQIGNGTFVGSSSDLTLTNGLGYGPISIQVTPTSGMTGLSPATYTNILIYAPEPTPNQVTLLSATATTTTTTTLGLTAGSGTGHIIVMKEGSMPTPPVDGVVYDQVPGNDFSATSGSGNYFTGTGSVVVYKGAGTAPTIIGLTPGKTYYFAAYTYNGGTTPNSKPNYLLTGQSNFNSTTTPSAEPTIATSGLTFGQVTANSIKLNWTNGNGEKRIVIAKAGGAPAGTPTDGAVYTANSAFGDPTTVLGDGFVVYNGNLNSLTVTNLLPGTEYYFAIYEYNGTGTLTNYYLTAATGSRFTLSSEPTLQAHNIAFTPQALGTNTQLTLSWVRGNGAGVVGLVKAGAPISSADFPLDQGAALTANVSYGAGTVSGDAYVFYNGTGTSQTVTGLQYGQTYYFRLFEYNGTAAAYASSTVNYNTNTAIGNPGSAIADSYEPNDLMSQAKYLGTADGTVVPGIISSSSDVDWFTVEPDVAGGNNNLRIKLMNLPKDYTLELYNASGRRLRSSKFSNTTDEVIVINNVPAGVYYIKITSANGDFSITPYRVNALQSQLEYKSETP